MKYLSSLFTFALFVLITPLSSAWQPASKPPLPFEDQGACPFECCTYRRWTVRTETVIRKDRHTDSPVVFTVRRGERIVGVTGVVVTTRPGKATILQTVVIDGIEYVSGDTLYLLTYLGEGFYKVWYRGQIAQMGMDDNSAFKVNTRPESVWWVKIRNRRWQTGWSRQPENFDNKDACG
jgi:hypothetical protein